MTKLELVKAAGLIVVNIGVGAIVNNAVKATTPNNTGPVNKVCILIGGLVLTSMISKQTNKYAEEQIDSAVDAFKGVIKEAAKA